MDTLFVIIILVSMLYESKYRNEMDRIDCFDKKYLILF